MKKVKKLIGVVLVFSMISTLLTGCSNSDYEEAKELYNDGKWAEAIELFEELGDYEDSAKLLVECKYNLAAELFEKGSYDDAHEGFKEIEGNESIKDKTEFSWYMLATYVGKEGEVKYQSPDDAEYIVTMSIDNNNSIYVEYQIPPMYGVDVSFNFCLVKGATEVELIGSATTSLLGARMEESGKVMWDISSYKAGDEVGWDEYDIGGVTAQGTPIASDAQGLITTYDIQSTRMVNGIKQILAESELNITVQDIGFTNYE